VITSMLSAMTGVTAWPELMTVTEVAEILRVSKMTVYRLVHDGTLESARVGRSFRVHAASLHAYVSAPVAP
jgi:excisionase family DNA binding protein